MRGVSFVALCKCGCGREPACVPAHDFDDGDWRGDAHGFGVSSRAHSGERDEAGCAAVAGAVVGEHEIVVDGFGYIDDAEGQTCRFRRLPDAVAGGRGVVAADDEPAADVVFAKRVQDRLHILVVQLAAGRTEHGARRLGDALPFVGGCAAQVYQVAAEDAFHAVVRAIYLAEIVGVR